jgi:hypothetical protein
MFKWISRLSKLWEKKGFEVLLISLIVGFVVFALYNYIMKNKGTTDSYAFSILNGRNSQEHQNLNTSASPHLNSQNNESHVNQNQPLPYYYSNDEGDSIGERECRRVLQEIFQQPFNRARPNFLKNPVNKRFNLELDCYNENFKLAVEYNGAQHYKFIPYFHKNKESFTNQRYRDEIKKKLCQENNIILIEVPYTVKTKDIKEYLMDKLKNI